MATTDESVDQFCATMDGMTKSLSSVREAVQGLLKNADPQTKNGISLLSLKHHLLLSYIHSLALLTAHRVLGHSLTTRTRPSQPFIESKREARGADAGDLVDTLVEDRVVLEKVKQLESKMRYQIEKLVRLAEEDMVHTEVDVVNDPLAFRPNPENLMDKADSSSEDDSDGADRPDDNSIYRPPKLAPVHYTEKKKGRSREHVPVPTGLAQLAQLDGSNPHMESTSGLGSLPSMASARARELARMNDFEEENMTRLVMTKKEARRRARDEEDVALGGTGTSKGRRRGGGLEDEFADVLRTVDRGSRSGLDDGYETLRVKGRKQDAFSRSKTRSRDLDDEGGRVKKRTRFQAAVKNVARKKK